MRIRKSSVKASGTGANASRNSAKGLVWILSLAILLSVAAIAKANTVFSWDSTLESWFPAVSITNMTQTNGTLQFQYTGGGDPQISPISTAITQLIPTATDNQFTIAVSMTKPDNALERFQVFYDTSASGGIAEAKSFNFNVTPNIGRQVITFNIPTQLASEAKANSWTGNARILRIDPGDTFSTSAVTNIDFISFSPAAGLGSAPTVISSTLGSTNPVTLPGTSSVDFNVQFSDAVVNADTGDFNLTTTGSASGVVQSVTGRTVDLLTNWSALPANSVIVAGALGANANFGAIVSQNTKPPTPITGAPATARNVLRLTTRTGSNRFGTWLYTPGIACKALHVDFGMIMAGGNGSDGMCFEVGALTGGGFTEFGENIGLTVSFIETGSDTIQVRTNGTLVNTTAANFMQTEANTTDTTPFSIQPVSINVTTAGLLTVSIHGVAVINNLNVSAIWNPLATWKMGFGARNGGNTDFHAVADLRITNSDIKVTVGSLAGAGTLRLNTVASASIQDFRDVSIGAAAFTGGSAYTINHNPLIGLSNQNATFATTEVDSGVNPQQTVVTVTNTAPAGAATLTGTISLPAGDFSFISGGGAYSLIPGQSQNVVVEFNPSAPVPPGARSALLSITHNGSGTASPQTLTLNGTATDQKLTLSPGSINFGSIDIDLGQTASQNVTITNSGTSTLGITSVTLPAGDFVIFSDSGETTLAPAATRTVAIRFDPTTVGLKSGTLTVVSDDTNGIGAGTQAVSLSGTGTNAQLSLSTNNLNFGTRDLDQGASGNLPVTIINNRAVSVTVNSVTLSAGGADFTLTGGGAPVVLNPFGSAGDRMTVQVSFKNILPVGTKNGTLHVVSTDPAFPGPAFGPDASLTGTTVNPELGVAPPSLDFGEVRLACPSSLNVTVSNTGDSDLNVTGVSIVGTDAAHYSVTGALPGTITPSGSVILSVTFDPLAVGLRDQATLQLASDDFNDPTVNVPLSGLATDQTLELIPASPSLSFPDTEIDAGPSASQSFTVRNAGTDNSVFLLATTSITGTNPADFSISPAPGLIFLAAGDTQVVNVTFNPSAVGLRSALIHIESNDCTAASVDVPVSGTGLDQELAVAPPSVNFGTQDIDLGPTAVQTVTISNVGTAALVINSLALSGAPFQYKNPPGAPTTPFSLNPGEDRLVDLEFDPSVAGPFSGSLTVNSNDAHHIASIIVPLDGTGSNNVLTASPASINFGSQDINSGPTASQTVTITNARTGPVNITSVTLVGADASEFSITADSGQATLASGGVRTVDVDFDPELPKGAKSTKLRIVSNDIAFPIIEVDLTGTGLTPEIGFSPLSLDFGGQDVDLGASAPRSVVITNTGTSPLNLNSLTLAGVDASSFNIFSGGGAGTLAPGATRTVELTFQPASTGVYNAFLRVDSSATNVSNPVDYPITGTGTNNQITASPGTLSFPDQDIDDGPTAVQTVTITNGRNITLNISSITIVVISGNMPFAIDADSGELSLAPNETRTVDIVFDPLNLTPAAKLALLRIVSDDPAAPTIDVTLSGLATDQEISVSPASASFGSYDIDLGSTAPTDVTITNIGTGPLDITSVTIIGTNAADFNIFTDTSEPTILANGTRTVRVRFNPITTGPKVAQLQIVSDDTNHTPTVVIPLDGDGTNNVISFSPSSMSFGSQDVADGPTATQTMTITNTRTVPIDITSVSLVGANLADFVIALNGAPITLAPNDSRLIQVAFDPVSVGSKVAKLRVNTTDPTFLVIDVDLDGTATGVEIAGLPPSIDFGSQDINQGASASQDLVITNAGTATLTLNGVGITGADNSQFAIATDTGETSLAPGLSRTISITFNPDTVGVKNAFLSVSSNDSNDPNFNTPLTGTGTDNIITVSPASINFGSQQPSAGPTGATTVTITNPRTFSLNLTSVAIVGGNSGEFLILSDTGQTTLAPGGIRTLQVVFDPLTAGSKTSTLRVNSTDPTAPVVNVALSGFGGTGPTPTVNAVISWEEFE